MLKVLSSILCDLDPKVKALGQKAGICDGVPSTSALVNDFISWHSYKFDALCSCLTSHQHQGSFGPRCSQQKHTFSCIIEFIKLVAKKRCNAQQA